MPYFTDDGDDEAQETKQLEEEEIGMKEGGLDECINLYLPPETPLKRQYEIFFFFKKRHQLTETNRGEDNSNKVLAAGKQKDV